jgi:hypothetical protein
MIAWLRYQPSQEEGIMYRAFSIAALVICFTTILASLTRVVQAQETSQSVDQEYTLEQINNTPAEVFLERMAKPEPGYHKFSALWALARKAKEANAETRWSILKLVTTAMYDKSRTEYQRFQCCYVISDSGDEQWAPQLVYVLLNDPSVTMRSVAAEALGKFKNCATASDGLIQASKQEKDPKVIESINRSLYQDEAKYTPEQIKATSAEVFLERMIKPELGYHKFAAMWALGEKAKGSDSDARMAIMSLVITAMYDKSRTEYQRWQCCYVISDCGDERWTPPLIDMLMGDQSFVVRSVAAEALGKFPNCTEARNALVNAQRQETDQRVLDVINRILSK